jgi:hypothetical protein
MYFKIKGKMFDYYNTRLTSTHVIKRINEFQRFHIKSKKKFNSPKDYIFFFPKKKILNFLKLQYLYQ